MAKLPQITNLYVIAGLATIGGLIQGFDVSSLSAIIGTKQVRDVIELIKPVLLVPSLRPVPVTDEIITVQNFLP
jgi:hypothetical protein